MMNLHADINHLNLSQKNPNTKKHINLIITKDLKPMLDAKMFITISVLN